MKGFPDHKPFRIIKDSSSMSPLVLGFFSSPRAFSSAVPPSPTPRMNLPLESLSIVIASLAIVVGLLLASGVTVVPIVTLFV